MNKTNFDLAYNLLHLLFFLPLLTQAQCELYDVDFKAGQSSTSQYTASCGTFSSSHWTVIDDTCNLLTSPIILGGSGNTIATPVTVKINPSGNLADCDDYVIVQYRVDSTLWVTQDSINACDSNFSNNVQQMTFDIVCGDTSALEVRVVMASGDNGNGSAQKLRIMDGGICIGNPTILLPVELLNFEAQLRSDFVEIIWATSSEFNNSYYMVERSMDGVNFEQLTIVPGAGMSYNLIEYSVMDDKPTYGPNYYRLKQIDYDGSYEYSSIIAVNYDLTSSIPLNIYPNPVIDSEVYFSFSNVREEELFVSLYDPLGRVVFSKIILLENHGNYIAALDNQVKLSPGIYLVTGSSNNDLFNQKLVIRESQAINPITVYIVASR